MQIGIIGLGKMGSRVALKLVKEAHEVLVWNRSPQPAEDLKSQEPKIKTFHTIEELIKNLQKPRIVWVMLPAGDATAKILKEVTKYIQKDDIVIDAANSKYIDTEKHAEMFNKLNVRFLGIGVSGGIIAVKQGYPMMVGGDKSAYEYIKPLLTSLATPHGGHEYFGTGGAGHFVKMVHNGIEYPFMQALGEGFGILENSSYNFDLVKIAKLYQQGTLVSGFMLDRVVEALTNDHKLKTIQGVIGSASKEAVWTIEEGKKHSLPVESIEQAHDFRIRSETDKQIQLSFAARMVGALRIAFGGHPVKRKQ
ncbi:MAG TPA: NADP-dependent phosphogluconate dehydrogenase [Candidatus Sulfotelmatobacter sp.]|jgi:6-phosphogluconate dehydrogenase|nr:NADP-dependent phosphogluconate dehydrogenase [Candidatus Sulfotelmatobacter sp.]